MKLRDVSPGEGVVWVRHAFRVFFRQPFGFAALFASCALVFYACLLIPLIGGLALLVLAPVGSLLFMIATRCVVVGEAPLRGAFQALTTADRARLVGLAKLGIAYLAAASVAYWIIATIDGGALGAVMEAANDPKATPESVAAKMADPRLEAGFLARIVIGTLLSVPFWHAPALVFWAGQGWAKSLFSSSVAMWRNKGAFFVYGLAWAVLLFVLAMVIGIAAGAVGTAQVTVFAAPLLLFFSTVFYASLWFTFAGCFADDTQPAAPAGA